MRKWTYIATSWVLYGIGLAAIWIIERTGLMDVERDEHEEPPWYHSALFGTYQWCMVTSAHLDEWDALWVTTTKRL